MKITAIVQDRVIAATVDGTPVGGIGVDSVELTLSDDWDGFEHYALWFQNGNHPEPVMFDYDADGVTIDTIPELNAGQLRLTVDAWDGDGTDHHQITERMRRGIRIERHGAHSFGVLEEAASATLQRLNGAAEDCEDATAASQTQTAAAAAAESQRAATFSASQASNAAAFSSAQSGRASTFTEKMTEWQGDVDTATASAGSAASSANSAAASATSAASSATSAAASATSAATAANTKASLADTKAALASTAATNANTAATNANTAKDAANTAANLANTKAGLAADAAENANGAAASAMELAGEAQALIDSSSAAQLSGEITLLKNLGLTVVDGCVCQTYEE